jgi:hypothetical protein
LDTEEDEKLDVTKMPAEVINGYIKEMRKKIKRFEKMEDRFYEYKKMCEAKLAQGKSEYSFFDGHDTSRMTDSQARLYYEKFFRSKLKEQHGLVTELVRNK